MTDPERHAFFIAHLARGLNEDQLRGLITGAQAEMHISVNEQRAAPALSKVQRELCDWLCQDGYRATADERLTAERDNAYALARASQDEVSNATRGFDTVKRQASRIRSLKSALETQLLELATVLKDVPEPR